LWTNLADLEQGDIFNNVFCYPALLTVPVSIGDCEPSDPQFDGPNARRVHWWLCDDGVCSANRGVASTSMVTQMGLDN
jgi:hypothetical protein